MSQVTYMLANPREAHSAVVELWHRIKAHASTGARSILHWYTTSSVRRHALRKAFHGPVLRTIAEQVWLHDPKINKLVRYHPLVWKHYFAELFIEPEFEEYRVRATGEIKVRQKRRSTEALSDDDFAEFLTQVQAWAVTELDVTFPEDDTYE